MPTVMNSPLLVDPERKPDDTFLFTLRGESQATYVIQVSQNLSSWMPWQTNVIPASGDMRVMDSDKMQLRFYRAVLLSPAVP